MREDLGRKTRGGFGTVGGFPDIAVLPGGGSSRPGRAGCRGRLPSPGGGVGDLGARFQLCPPDIAAASAAAARCCAVPAAGFSVPAAPRPGGVWLGYFLTHIQASVRDRVLPSRSPCLRPGLCSSPAVDACGFAGWVRLRPGEISTRKKCPASKLTAWPCQTTPVQVVGAQCTDN